MSNPLAIIAMAIQDHALIDDALPPARAAVAALTDARIISHAVQALRAEGFGSGLSDSELADAASVVLRSVAGGP